MTVNEKLMDVACYMCGVEQDLEGFEKPTERDVSVAVSILGMISRQFDHSLGHVLSRSNRDTLENLLPNVMVVVEYKSASLLPDVYGPFTAQDAARRGRDLEREVEVRRVSLKFINK